MKRGASEAATTDLPQRQNVYLFIIKPRREQVHESIKAKTDDMLGIKKLKSKESTNNSKLQNTAI